MSITWPDGKAMDPSCDAVHGHSTTGFVNIDIAFFPPNAARWVQVMRGWSQFLKRVFKAWISYACVPLYSVVGIFKLANVEFNQRKLEEVIRSSLQPKTFTVAQDFNVVCCLLLLDWNWNRPLWMASVLAFRFVWCLSLSTLVVDTHYRLASPSFLVKPFRRLLTFP